MEPKTSTLSSRIEDLCSSIADLRQFFADTFHDRLVGPLSSASISGPVNSASSSLLDQLEVRINGAESALDNLRSMIRNVGGRI